MTLAEKRRQAQRTLAKAIRFRKASQLIHDRAMVKFTAAYRKYQKLDLLYAEQRVVICPKRRSSETKKPFNSITAKVNKMLDGLDPLVREKVIMELKKKEEEGYESISEET